MQQPPAGVQRPVRRSERSGGIARLLTLTGALLLTAAFASLVAARFADSNGPQLLLALAAPVLLAGAAFALYRGRQHRAVVAEERRLRDRRPPILYLRSFKADTSAALEALAAPFLHGYLRVFSSTEEQLANALEAIGPLVALGRPGETLPAAGAARQYAEKTGWQELVDRRLREARLVLINAGESEGLLWEIDRSLQILNPERVVILLWMIGESQYEHIARRVNDLDSRTLPPFSSLAHKKPVISGFLYFEDDWSPRFSPLAAPYFRVAAWKPWEPQFNHALKPIVERLGFTWRPSPISKATVVAAVLGATMIALLLVAMLVSVILE